MLARKDLMFRKTKLKIEILNHSNENLERKSTGIVEVLTLINRSQSKSTFFVMLLNNPS